LLPSLVHVSRHTQSVARQPNQSQGDPVGPHFDRDVVGEASKVLMFFR
jgi:hypothetical protein